MSFFKNLLDLLYPPRCPFCRRVAESGKYAVCPHCLAELPFTSGGAMHKKGEFFDDCVSPLFYRGKVRDSILRYKFKGTACYAESYAGLLLDCIDSELDGKYDVISYVPISARRLRRRGYDQARLLAEAIAEAKGKTAETTLTKTVDAPAQSTLRDPAERRANVMGAYRACGGIDGKRILLIDDIVTTGATLAECSRTLLTAGAESVVCAALAKGE